MKVKLIGGNNYFGDIQEEYFKNRDVENIELFKNLSKYVPTNYSKFTNMDEAVKLLAKHIKLNSKIVGIPDSDVDGMTSMGLLYRFLKDNFSNKIKLDYAVHNDNKAHGIFINELEEKGFLSKGEDGQLIPMDDFRLLVVPDAGSECYKEFEILSNIGVDVLVLDHHPTNVRSNKAVVVNNQFDNVSVHLTGVGMVLKFIEAVSEKTKKEIPDSYYNLVALGLIGDSADSRDLDVQYYIQRGLKNVDNKIINAIAEQVNFSIKGLIDQESVGWYIAPLINGCIRYGSKEERELLFEAFAEIDDDRVFEYTYQRGANKGSVIEENLYQHVCRMSSSLKSKQDREMTKIVEGNTKVKGIVSNIVDNASKKVLVVDLTEYVSDGSLTGILANKLSNYYKKPIIALRKITDNDENVSFGGSARGDKIHKFKTKLNMSKILSGSGHESAFGIHKFSAENDLIKIESELNEYFKDEDIESLYEVDFIIPFNEVSEEMIEDLYSLKEFWGHGMSAPLFYLENIKVKTNEIKTNDKLTFMSFSVNYIDFIKFKMTQEKYDELVDWKEYMCYNIVGKPFVKNENGERKVGFVIQDIEPIITTEDIVEEIDWDCKDEEYTFNGEIGDSNNDDDDWNNW